MAKSDGKISMKAAVREDAFIRERQLSTARELLRDCGFIDGEDVRAAMRAVIAPELRGCVRRMLRACGFRDREAVVVARSRVEGYVLVSSYRG